MAEGPPPPLTHPGFSDTGSRKQAAEESSVAQRIAAAMIHGVGSKAEAADA